MLRALSAMVLCTAALCASEPPQYTEAARLTREQRWKEALAIVDTLLPQYPDNPKLLNLQGLALLGSGRVKEAGAAFEKALAKAPDFAPALKNLAILDWDRGAPGAAARTEAALKLNAADPVLNAYGALSAITRDDVKAAATRLERAQAVIGALPPKLQYRLALGFAKRRFYPQAVLLLRAVVQAGGDSPAVRYNLALAEYLGGRYQDAIATLEPLRANGASAEALNLLGQAWERAGDPQKAIDTLRAAAALYPRDENNYLDLSNICIDHDAIDQGIAVIEVGLRYMPSSARLNFQMGLLEVLRGHLDTAQAAFDKAAALEPASDLPGAALQLSAIQQSRLPEAIAGLRREAAEKPRSGIVQCLLGMALLRSGAGVGSPDERDAELSFRKAVELEPSLPYPYLELGKMYMRRRQPADAVPWLERAVRMPDVARGAAYQLGVAYRDLNEQERSREMFAKVRQMVEADRSRSFVSSSQNP